MVKSVCSHCGVPYERTRKTSYCDECQPPRGPKDYRLDKPKGELGYTTAWRKLSERARKKQTYCSDCGTTDDLTADHSVRAWERFEQGLPIRLQDIDVVCRRCNVERGPARGPNASDEHRSNRLDLSRLTFGKTIRAKRSDPGGVGRSGPDPSPRAEGKIPISPTQKDE